MPKQESASKYEIKKPYISLPKGGGAVKNIGETFSANAFSGTGSYSIPIPVTPARGFDPQLALSYNSGLGNSEFGMGFSLSLPRISVRTDKGIPEYNSNDVFILSGLGELTPKLIKKNGTLKKSFRIVNKKNKKWTVFEYLPRLEAGFAKIEHWIHTTKEHNESYWKIISSDNTTSIYGKDEKNYKSRIRNPENKAQIFAWLIEESVDASGNKLLFQYKAENNDNVPDELYEQNRLYTANRYIQTIKYGNYFTPEKIEKFAFEVVFDYGEYDVSALDKGGKDPYVPSQKWSYRSDAFSSYKSGFEIRTYRLCKNILLFHHFENELGAPCLVKSVHLEYAQANDYGDTITAGFSLIKSVVFTGYRRDAKNAADPYCLKQLPPLSFKFTQFSPPQKPVYKKLEVDTHPIPGYLHSETAGFTPVDLNGEGISGFLYHDHQAILYLEPQGNGKYSSPQKPELFPTDRDFYRGAVSLADLEGNGKLQLVVSDAERTGFYQKSNSSTLWENYQAFETYLTDHLNHTMETVSLASNGRADMLLVEDKNILVYPSKGKAGYEAAKKVKKQAGFPSQKYGYLQEHVAFANMFGDGLAHRIKITKNSVECWPSLGYGKFGKKITLKNAPDFGDDFDSSRLFLTDIDGSGTTDLAYVDADKIRLFLNQNGNAFSDAIEIAFPETYSETDQINFLDINGNGTNCLVFTKMKETPVHYCYNFIGSCMIDGSLHESIKPYLLYEIDANRGGVTQIEYTSSSEFYLADKKAGRPWLTKLPFPVQVVKKVITIDKISGARFTSHSAYHDGYYDYEEKEFCGFAFVETWDSEIYDEYKKNYSGAQFSSQIVDTHSYAPPIYTKVWRHTGAMFKSSAYKKEYFTGDKEAYDFPDSVIEVEILKKDPETIRQAYASLKGHVMRTELYAQDGTEKAKTPYTVTESNLEVSLHQEKADQKFAVFMVKARESIAYHYERDLSDPRISQEFVLETDTFGNVATSCSVVLPRRTGACSHKTIYPQQQALKGMVGCNNFVEPLNVPEGNEFTGCHLSWQSKSLELSGLELKGKKYFSWDEIKKQVSAALKNTIPYEGNFAQKKLEARLLSWVRSYFWNKEQTEVLGGGKIAAMRLLHHTEQACFTKKLIKNLYANRLTDEIIYKQGGYFFDDATGYWWNKGLVQHYFNVDQKERFYLPTIAENKFALQTQKTNNPQELSLYSKVKIDYDAYFFSPIKSTTYIDETDPEHCIASVSTIEIDRITQQIKQIIDSNNNVAQVLFDPLGQVVASSHFGTEDGKLAGGMTLYPQGKTPAEYKKLTAKATFDDVLAHPEKYLQGAADFFFYTVDSWEKKQQPDCAIHLVREKYYHDGNGDRGFSCKISLTYADGLGRALEAKVKTDPGEAFIRDSKGALVLDSHNTPVKKETDNCWQVTGRTIYNNKGMPYKQYLPYLSNTPNYESQQEIVEKNLLPPPTVMHYDSLGREVRIDTPKGFFSKVEFDAWEEKHFDENDTIKDSRYYQNFMRTYPKNPTRQQQDEKDALDKAAEFYNTPGTTIADTLGHVFLSIQNNLGQLSKNSFAEIVAKTAIKSADIFNDLADKGYITKDGWLRDKFQPYTKNFVLRLDAGFQRLTDKITTFLKQGCITSYAETDISGKPVKTIDARLYYSNIKTDSDYYNFIYKDSMCGSVSYADGVDAGIEKHFSNIFGAQLWSWSPRDYCQLIAYDRIGRKKELRVKKITDKTPIVDASGFNLVEKFVYGDELVRRKKEPAQKLKERNLWGNLYELYDLSGIVKNSRYGLQGEALENSRQMAAGYKKAINWNEKVALMPEVYATTVKLNALGQTVTETSPDGSLVSNTYNQAGALTRSKVRFADGSEQRIIDDIRYNAQGQKLLEKHGNGVVTTYEYEKTTLRMTNIHSKRSAVQTKGTTRDATIQDIAYVFDPVGNITRTRDHTCKTIWNKNQQVEPLSDYTYDGLYRLVKANGRQHPGINKNTFKNNPHNDDFKQSKFTQLPALNDSAKLENYAERYTYDDSGNLINKQHTAASLSWNKETPVENNSNRLQNGDYDSSGNLRKLMINGNVLLSFNCCENLVKAGIIKRQGALDDCDYYVYDSAEQRTRKVCERMKDGGAAVSIEEKIYLGNFEIKRNKSVQANGNVSVTMERQTLKIDDVIIHYISKDATHPEKEHSRQCRFQLNNNLGSVSLELDTSGNLISYEEYFPYGGTAIITGKNKAEVKLKEYRYSGKERDDSTGLYYYGARYYAPWLGRWLKPDPAGTIDGMNLYAFVGGSPIVHEDIEGMDRTERKRGREKKEEKKAREKKEARKKAREDEIMKGISTLTEAQSNALKPKPTEVGQRGATPVVEVRLGTDWGNLYNRVRSERGNFHIKFYYNTNIHTATGTDDTNKTYDFDLEDRSKPNDKREILNLYHTKAGAYINDKNDGLCQRLDNMTSDTPEAHARTITRLMKGTYFGEGFIRSKHGHWKPVAKADIELHLPFATLLMTSEFFRGGGEGVFNAKGALKRIKQKGMPFSEAFVCLFVGAGKGGGEALRNLGSGRSDDSNAPRVTNLYLKISTDGSNKDDRRARKLAKFMLPTATTTSSS